MENEMWEAVSSLYAKMDLFSEAVEVALTKCDDISLAQMHVSDVEDDDELQKKLYKRIAQFLIMEKKDIDQFRL